MSPATGLLPFAERELDPYQCGFRKGKSTTDQIFCLRVILERAGSINFIDLKADDRINREELVKVVKDFNIVVAVVLLLLLAGRASCYDPDDKLLDTVLPRDGSKFEPFYPRKAYGLDNGDSRPAHGHGTFYQHRHPALVDAANAPAYGFRFDGKRRFNFD